MAIDFGVLPPEINSARLYAGVGSTPLMTASSAWNALAAELSQTALCYENVVTQLSSEEWLGPASASMAAAVQPYVDWINATAVQAEEAAIRAQSAAAAFENAFASVVPPPLIAANRAELAQAVMSNLFGQNNGVIAQLEAQYAEFWAQDADAMYTYAGSSASASKVTPFAAAPQTTNPAAQTTAAAAAAGTSAASAQNTLNSLITQITTALGNLANPFLQPADTELAFFQSADGPLSGLWKVLFGTPALPSNFQSFLTAYTPYAGVFYNTEGLPYFSIGMANNFVQTSKTLGLIHAVAAPAAAAASVPKGMPALGGLLGGGSGGAPISATLGNAASVGRLSVPAVWSEALPSVHHSATPVAVSNIREAPDVGTGNLLGGMPLAGAGTSSNWSSPRYGFRPTVMARPPVGG